MTRSSLRSAIDGALDAVNQRGQRLPIPVVASLREVGETAQHISVGRFTPISGEDSDCGCPLTHAGVQLNKDDDFTWKGRKLRDQSAAVTFYTTFDALAPGVGGCHIVTDEEAHA